jgi:phosphatidylglycerol:prolipoprotein diacylglycerol transferase
MSFHGGVIGIIIASIIFSKKNNDDVFKYLDIIALVSPIGIFFGRIANFINSELYGLKLQCPLGSNNLFKLIIYIGILHSYMKLL